jgi:hypothetical protein
MITILTENPNWETQVIFVIENNVYESIMRGYEEFHNEDELFFYLTDISVLSRNEDHESIKEICNETTFTNLNDLQKLNLIWIEEDFAVQL